VLYSISSYVEVDIVIEVISKYPFLLALLGAMVIELSAILIRRAAQVLSWQLWILSGGLSIVGAATLIWSFLWANAPATSAIVRGSFFNLSIGPILILSGIVWLARPLIMLGRQAFLPWPTTRLITNPPYEAMRRPMILGLTMLAIGLPLTTMQTEGWIWFGVWFMLAQPLLELEEWEMRSRFPEADAYLDRTPRYFRWRRR
jgi:hypothetical protein